MITTAVLRVRWQQWAAAFVFPLVAAGCVGRGMRAEEERPAPPEGSAFQAEIRAEGSRAGAPAVLLLHGYGGSPHDMRPPADALKQAGIAHHAPALPGHDRTPREMISVTHAQWLRATRAAYDALKKKHDRVSVVGFSMGGSLALCLAAEVEVEKLVVVSPYFRVQPRWYYFGSAEAWAGRMHGWKPYVKKWRIGQINDPAGLARYRAFEVLPVRTTLELAALGALAREKAKAVTADTLWLHSIGDSVAAFDTSRAAFLTLPAARKEFVPYARSNHILLYDYDAPDALRRITHFLDTPAATRR